MRKQLVDDRNWRKLNFVFSFFPSPVELEKIEADIDGYIGFWTRNEPFSELEVKGLLDSNILTDTEIETLIKKYTELGYKSINKTEFKVVFADIGRKLKTYLNLIEKYCVGLNAGVGDIECAKHIYGFKFRAHFAKAKPYIEKVRDKKGDPSLFIELEKVLRVWEPKKEPESTPIKY